MEKYRIGILNGRRCRGEDSLTWEREIVWMKLEISSAPPLKFLCSTSKAGTAFAVWKNLVKASHLLPEGWFSKRNSKVYSVDFFFLLQLPKKKLIHMHLTARGKFSVQRKVT